MRSVEADILESLVEVHALIARALEQIGGKPEAGSALDQAGLLDGDKVVRDYIHHGEAGLAFEHLIYMVREPSLVISDATYDRIRRAGATLNLNPKLWNGLKVC
jgi:hypothetical protein